jgi:hypothetical protein
MDALEDTLRALDARLGTSGSGTKLPNRDVSSTAAIGGIIPGIYR